MKALKLLTTTALAVLSMNVFGSQIKTLSSQDGISNNAICSIHQNRLGHLYVGTMDGLNIWDGKTMKTFVAADGKNYFFGNQIKHIIPGKDGNLYLQTNYGTARLNMTSREVMFYDKLAFNSAIAVTDDGNIFSISASNELQYLDTESSELMTFTDMIFTEDENCRRMGTMEDGRLCIFSDKETYIITFSNESKPSIREVENLNIGCLYVSVKYDGHNHIILSEDLRICTFDDRTGEIRTISEIESGMVEGDRVTGLIPDETGFLISFMQNGVRHLSQASGTLENTEINCGVFSMVPDKKQPIVWIGTDCNGLIRWSQMVSDISCITFNDLPYSIEMPVRCLYLDKKSDLWFGTKGDGLYRIRDFTPKGDFSTGNTDRYTKENSAISHNSVYTIVESSHDLLWIGSEGAGLNYYSFRTGKLGTVKGSGNLMCVHDVIEQDESTIWVATDKHGCYKCCFTVVNGIPAITEIEEIQFIEPFNNKSSIFSMSMGNDSTMWFASRGNGVLSYNINTGKSRVMQFSTDDGLATNETFYVTKTEEMLFATGNGIVTYSPENNTVSIPDFVPKKAIHSILPDGNGNIWITTNSGIISLDSEFNYRTSFDRFYGMEVLEYSDGACYRDHDSRTLFFGGINGFTVIDEDSIHDADSATYTPDLNITNFIQNNEFSHISQKTVKGKLRIPYSKSIFAIEYSLVDNLNYPDYMIMYQIDGYNDEWITNKSDNNIIYLPALNPGNYELKIKYINQATSYESDECCLPIYIIPPIYKRWYAFFLYGLLVILGIILLVRYLRYKYISMKDRLRKRYEKEIMKVKSETTSTIAEELSVQITFMLGLCQQIRQQTQNNQNIASKVNLIEYNIAKTNKILHILNEYKGISESINSHREVALIHVSQIANELIEIMKSSTLQKNVTLFHEIERDIIISMNKEGFLTLFNTLTYKIISIASGDKKVFLQIKRREKGGLTIRLSATAERQAYEEMSAMMENYERRQILGIGDNDEDIRNFEFILCSKLVKEMNGRLTYNYVQESGCLEIDIELPQSNIGENQIKYVDSPISENINTLNTLVENQLPEKGRTYQHLKHIFLISANKEISSFMSYFLSEKYGIYEYTGNESALEETMHHMPEAIIYHVSSMAEKFAEFMEKIKGNKRTSQIPVIALTSSLQITEREECIKQGADLCITFPFNMDYLRSALEKMLNRHESIAEYYKSSLSTYVMNEGKIIHRDDKEFINNVLKVIEDNLSSPDLSASMISRQMGMSTRVMYRRLEGITDKSLHQIIKDSRMDLATRLLSSSKMTIDEIMYKVGYDNRSTFYRNFKESKGMTPKEYREKIKDNVIQTLSPSQTD